MSDLIANRQVSDSKDCPPVAFKPVHQKIMTREAKLGGDLTIHRALPHQERRMIGAWCFLDHFGPLTLTRQHGLDIAPHPHMGLQTFTWLISGKIMHKDSLGNEQIIGPAQVNLMTAGEGISHSEQSVMENEGEVLHGLQLWIALPDDKRHMAPDFHHYAESPVYQHDNLQLTIVAGELFNMQANTHIYSPLLGVDIQAVKKNGVTQLPLQPEFEYGVIVLEGEAKVENELLKPDELLYLGCGRETLKLQAAEGTHLFLIGGKPFKEEVLVWWNFVGRTEDEMIQAVKDWETGTRFGVVRHYEGGRLHAPALAEKK